MKKFAMTMTAFTVIAGGLAGCGAGDNGNDNEMGAAPTRYTDDQNVNNFGTRNTTNYDRNYRGEGPVTDMMTIDDRDRPGRNNNRMRAYNTNQREIGNGSGVTDLREGGHARNLDGRDNGMATNDRGNGNMQGEGLDNARKIENSVENIKGVDDAKVIVRDQDVIVGIDTYEDDRNHNDLTNKVEKKVKSAMDNDNVEVYVTTDEEQFGNIEQVGNDLQNGTGMNEVGDTIDAMIKDLGDAARQPFKNS
ncbi:YhcN/YlaJ family sporulation lipoprotein [Bacillus piscicola]|uniref:YhcN/YlaJ family sporulation lipoprotein n=1 Tax=Bacillus piscicola TaxID=1632684 RepID=UPI001F08AD69|nr:YhcN/YlaJ family sporulation lipoprotein [Bacillus piscicola]